MIVKKIVMLFLFLEMASDVIAYTPGEILLIKQKNGDMEKIEWGQSRNQSGTTNPFDGCSPSYNAHCPSSIGEVDQCQRTLAGCGAIAIGQLMAMWQHPSKSKYRTYNWDNIPPVLRDGNPEDCPLLIKDIGLACNMHYQTFAGISITGSWCTSNNMVDALETFSYYVSTCDKEDWLKYNTIENWNELIRTEIDCGRPVIMFGKKGSITESHYFIIDGYSSFFPNKFHINWGWRGSKNDFIYLDDVEECGYINDQKIFYGIYPKRENAPKITYSKKRKYLLSNCQHTEYGRVKYEVTNADSWECSVYDRNGKLLWKGGGAVEDGIADVWDGSSAGNLSQDDYWLDITFKNSNGARESFSDHFTYITLTNYQVERINFDLINARYTPNHYNGENSAIEIKTDNASGYVASLYDPNGNLAWSSSGNVAKDLIRLTPNLSNYESGEYLLVLKLDGGCHCTSSSTESFRIFYDDSVYGEVTMTNEMLYNNAVAILKTPSALEMKSDEPLTEISVYTASGVCIAQEKCIGYVHSFNIERISQNLLIVVVQTENGIYSQKVIVN